MRLSFLFRLGTSAWQDEHEQLMRAGQYGFGAHVLRIASEEIINHKLTTFIRATTQLEKHMNKQHSDRTDFDHSSRVENLSVTTLSEARRSCSGGLTSLLQRSAAAAAGFQFVEATIPQLQAAMTSGQLASRELTRGYIDRIQSLNPLLHSVIQLNPNAIAIAAGLDNERRSGHVRGPLHGIPVLVKDNIATDDVMQTTAGSLALVNSHVPGDAVIIRRLREAGAVILGKANLGEWANFRGFINVFPLAVGWSARGGTPSTRTT